MEAPCRQSIKSGGFGQLPGLPRRQCYHLWHGSHLSPPATRLGKGRSSAAERHAGLVEIKRRSAVAEIEMTRIERSGHPQIQSVDRTLS
jgi:hypothetical protein